MSAKPLVQQFQDDINAVVDKYRDQGLTVAETIGVLVITGQEVWREADSHDTQEWEDD